MSKITSRQEAKGSQRKPLVSIYCDFQNVPSIKDRELAKLLLKFAGIKGCLSSKKIYYNSQCKSQKQAKDALVDIGFDWVDVPCPLKNSADNRLIADCIEDCNGNSSPDTIILVSGDGDFESLIGTLQKLGKNVIVFAQKGNVKQKISDLADKFSFVDELPQLVADKIKPQTTSLKSQIAYEDALECLIDAIKTALNQGIPTYLSQIGKLMRQSSHFPSCDKFPLVCKSDGTTFSRLSKLVNAAVADGKVRLQTLGKLPELLLIDEDILCT
jgi:hypothetical protein